MKSCWRQQVGARRSANRKNGTTSHLDNAPEHITVGDNARNVFARSLIRVAYTFLLQYLLLKSEKLDTHLGTVQDIMSDLRFGVFVQELEKGLRFLVYVILLTAAVGI